MKEARFTPINCPVNEKHFMDPERLSGNTHWSSYERRDSKWNSFSPVQFRDTVFLTITLRSVNKYKYTIWMSWCNNIRLLFREIQLIVTQFYQELQQPKQQDINMQMVLGLRVLHNFSSAFTCLSGPPPTACTICLVFLIMQYDPRATVLWPYLCWQLSILHHKHFRLNLHYSVQFHLQH